MCWCNKGFNESTTITITIPHSFTADNEIHFHFFFSFTEVTSYNCFERGSSEKLTKNATANVSVANVGRPNSDVVTNDVVDTDAQNRDRQPNIGTGASKLIFLIRQFCFGNTEILFFVFEFNSQIC